MSLDGPEIQGMMPRFLNRDCPHPPSRFGALRLALFFSLPHFGMARCLQLCELVCAGRAFGHDFPGRRQQIESCGL